MATKPNATVTSPAKTESQSQSRPPVVVVVGHVDHGKTTLLDYIRKANVAAREAGGITQAVGAYEIEHTSTGAHARKITFIDTPGHEAFSAMRARGAQIADLAILVVAADEGPKPQTREAIKILEETQTPFIVALNKIDKAGAAGIEKTKGALAEAGVLLEGYGGSISWQGVAAKTGEGVDELLDLILLASDLEDLRYQPTASARGFVLEARRDARRGIEASVIIKDGILRRGDDIATATARGKVKILENFAGAVVNELSPSAPAIVIGFDELPQVGEEFFTGEVARAMKVAATGANENAGAKKNAVVARVAPPKNALNLILKASDAGSLEALAIVLGSIDAGNTGSGTSSVHIIEQSVGDITDGDVKHALATGSTIIGFKNRVASGAATLADAQRIRIITSKIVYDLEKAVEEFLTGMNEPVVGELEVLAIFNAEKMDKQLVGGRVTTGTFRAKAACDIQRADAIPTGGTAGDAAVQSIGAGRILELREKKSEIATAEKGKEIGVLVSAAGAIQIGDKLIIRK